MSLKISYYSIMMSNHVIIRLIRFVLKNKVEVAECVFN
jgi:hypothetical protein